VAKELCVDLTAWKRDPEEEPFVQARSFANTLVGHMPSDFKLFVFESEEKRFLHGEKQISTTYFGRTLMHFEYWDHLAICDRANARQDLELCIW